MNGTLAIGMPAGGEWIIILIIALVVFGGYKKLPDVGSSMAASIRNFKKGMDEGRNDDGDNATTPTDPVTAETTTTKTQQPS